MNFLDELNDAQREAVLHCEGPSLIVAGPGSGKTRVLTYRIAYLLRQGVSPFSILALTFTNKAANEMRRRIEQIAGADARNLFMGTFHSVFARILRVEAPRLGYPSNFTIYDTDDSRSLLKSVVRELNLDEKVYKPNLLHYRISSAKNALITPDDYLQDEELLNEDRLAKRPYTANIYKSYCDRCFKSGAMDFDDLLLKTYEIFNTFPDVLYKYQHKFRFILIDEFQDTNPLQYSIVKRIADVFQNITVVGDDAQSIYAFRGATIDNILNFENDFPDLTIFKLEQNYRSTRYIVEAANKLIQYNKNQIKKNIWTLNDQGEKIKVVRSASDNEEGRFVAEKIQEIKMRDHLRNSDFAILYRTNAQSRAFEESLRKMNIPYKVYGGISFYQRKEIKDFIAYLKLIVNPKDEEALKRIINYPGRGIGPATVDKIISLSITEEKSAWEILTNIHRYDFTSKTKQAVGDFVQMMNSFMVLAKTKNAYEVAQHVGKATGIIAELYNDKTVEGVSRFENIQELLNSIKEFVENDVYEDNEENAGNDKLLGAFLQNIVLLTGDENEKENSDMVKLMTIHSAKGLEFPVVFVVGMEENLFPNTQAIYSLEELEEERRLFYVAVTRAEKKLFLSYAATRYRYGSLQYCQPSRFLNELPEEILSIVGDLKREQAKSIFNKTTNITRNIAAPVKHTQSSEPFVPDEAEKLQTGMDVLHEKFGSGKIIAMEGAGINRIATIFFEGYGQKKIMLKFARLQILKHS
ncbi:MAG: 3'-5' exonuclease [Chitinophagales bacterium]|nr:3'-5' exonuclease [Chitinophagales bacterium]